MTLAKFKTLYQGRKTTTMKAAQVLELKAECSRMGLDVSNSMTSDVGQKMELWGCKVFDNYRAEAEYKKLLKMQRKTENEDR